MSYKYTLFVKYGDAERILIICLYVNDVIYVGNDANLIYEFQSFMKKEFDMIDLGLMKYYYYGIEVKQQDIEIFISQKTHQRDS